MDWAVLLPFLMMGVEKLLDGVVDGAALNADGQRAVQTAYAAAIIWGDMAVESTKTDIDDQALEMFKRMCVDTSKEGEFPLPDLVMMA